MTQKNPQSGNRRLMKWILALSLALNLVFLGLVGGAMMRFAGEGDKRFDRKYQQYGTSFMRALPREAARDLRRSLRSAGADLPTRAERRALSEQIIVLLRADTFDRSAAEAVFTEQARAAQMVRDRAQTGWLDVISDMSAEDRLLVADRLEQGFDRKRPPKPPGN